MANEVDQANTEPSELTTNISSGVTLYAVILFQHNYTFGLESAQLVSYHQNVAMVNGVSFDALTASFTSSTTNSRLATLRGNHTYNCYANGDIDQPGVHYNRPPIRISIDEMLAGLAITSQAFTNSDLYVRMTIRK